MWNEDARKAMRQAAYLLETGHPKCQHTYYYNMPCVDCIKRKEVARWIVELLGMSEQNMHPAED